MIRPLTLACCLAVVSSVSMAAEKFTVETADDGVTVKHNGELLTRYLFKSGAKPILWPLIGPHGKEITRSYPMVEEGKETEKKDHIHHRSFYFTHGNVNGVDFWAETGKNGTIEHRKLVKAEGGDQAVIVTQSEWVTPAGEKILGDQRTLTFGEFGKSVWIDFDLKLTALAPVEFGDTKEGSFGIRVAGTMKTTAEKGGQIVSSHGDTDLEAWGKAAPWVDYHGPVEGETVGIAILNHPSSFRYPTNWHVRTYGLFAANPFGLSDFTKGAQHGEHKMAKGESIDLRYRVLIHEGDEKQGKVAEAFQEYEKVKKP
ncbi:DUF6807 domain-containing protein [Lignipirellula cremea]|uniref:Methane oxygenase PmoA n=1 Tax=Lignipirellula cremea TaxID=2528010 RepID=A0A518E122_9BACT|nr:PmoA family protein [Lignipirellula cremea]QDU97773.1 hypothetical protein Pla8534_56290 [Lignipirellula cremea]